MSDSCAPLVFVAMPFGKKPDPTRTFTIDFDDVYRRGIKRAVEGLGVDIIRSDEERGGGIIHVPMFERLLLADVTVVDVTIPNANVFYELGIRHAARPRSTIIIWANQGTLPFDIAMISSTAYELTNGTLSDEQAENLCNALRERVTYALQNPEKSDSPLFQLIPQFPGINLPHDVTENFRDRSRYVDGVRMQLEAARNAPNARDAIGQIEKSLGEPNQGNAELFIDTLFSYRDIGAWDAVVTLAERLPKWLFESSVPLRQQYALALNRRAQPGDREKAEQLLEAIVKKSGDDPETCGLLGRIWKDRYKEARPVNKLRATSFLDRAIEWYERGFTSDPRDYYPGVNLAQLLVARNSPDSIAKLQTILPAVTFAVARLGEPSDYWLAATAVELAVLANDWTRARSTLMKLAALPIPPFGRQTTLDTLNMVLELSPEGIDMEELRTFIKDFEDATTSLAAP